MLENSLKSLKLQTNQKHFLLDCIDLDIPNVLAPYEVYMMRVHSQEEEEPLSLKDLKETLEICLRQYSKEIMLLEKTFYQ